MFQMHQTIQANDPTVKNANATHIQDRKAAASEIQQEPSSAQQVFFFFLLNKFLHSWKKRYFKKRTKI